MHNEKSNAVRILMIARNVRYSNKRKNGIVD
ncbi:hypothetical protein ACN08S_19120 [Photobacterium leiognathi subsp. mandapamensis]